MRRAALFLMCVLALSACTDGSSPSPTPNGSVPGALPTACDLVTTSDVSSALGVGVSGEPQRDSPDRCRYTTASRDQVEVTVDRPGVSDAVGTYRALNPDAQPVPGIGEDAALRMANRTGELVFVNGPARFFVVVSGPSSSADALVALARAAAQRM